MIVDSFAAGEAARLASLDYKVLDYWCRSGFIAPSVSNPRGKGTDRRFSFADIVGLRVAATLRAEGISLQSLRRVVDHLKAQGYEAPLSQTMLVTDGRDLFECVGRDELVSVLTRPGQLAFRWVVDLGRIVEEINELLAA